MTAYQNIESRSREYSLVSSICSLLGWDHQTYLPSGASSYRGEQSAYLSSLAHRLFTADEVGGWLADCESKLEALNEIQCANVREWRRRYDRATKLPAELVEEFSRVTTAANDAWLAARKMADFSVFRPHLEKILELCTRKADLWGYEKSAYDALLDEYEPSVKSEELRKLFCSLSPQLSKLVEQGVALYEKHPAKLPDGVYPIERQKIFNQQVAAKFGFDFNSGRIDATTHPFCSGMGPNDCRLTTRYEETDFTNSLYSVLHETGHGLYDQGTLKEYYGTPAGDAVSLGIHESQSRFWENHIARHESFWEYWLPIAAKLFPQLKSATPQSMSRYVNRVRRGFIRVDADEVTYDLHIILRFNIETKLMDKTLAVKDVPAYWNEEFEKMFTVKVPNDSLGCLQDVHWSWASIGYFPTYTLGNLNAAQLDHTMRKAIPNMDALLSAGEYEKILSWLRQNIHRYGSVYSPTELMQKATGEKTNPEHHLAYLRKKVL